MPWMTAEHAAIARDLRAGRPASRCSTRAGSTRTMLVQAACSDADTDAMFEHAARARLDRRRHRVGRPRSRPSAADARLDELAAQPKLRGIRHLIHDGARPALDPPGRRAREPRAARGARPHARAALRLPAPPRRRPGARAQLPPADDRDRPPRQAAARHASEMGDVGDGCCARAAELPNVVAKISGLNTMLDRRPTGAAADLRRPVEVARRLLRPGSAHVRQRLAGRAAQRRLRDTSGGRRCRDHHDVARRADARTHTGRHARPPLPARPSRPPTSTRPDRRSPWSRSLIRRSRRSRT